MLLRLSGFGMLFAGNHRLPMGWGLDNRVSRALSRGFFTAWVGRKSCRWAGRDGDARWAASPPKPERSHALTWRSTHTPITIDAGDQQRPSQPRRRSNHAMPTQPADHAIAPRRLLTTPMGTTPIEMNSEGGDADRHQAFGLPPHVNPSRHCGAMLE